MHAIFIIYIIIIYIYRYIYLLPNILFWLVEIRRKTKVSYRQESYHPVDHLV